MPAVAANGRAVPGVDLAQVAALLALPFSPAPPALSPSALYERLRHALATAMRLTAQFPPAALAAKLPNRDRTCLGLANHIVEIAAGYLRVAAGAPFDVATSAAAPARELPPAALADRAGEVASELASTSTPAATAVTAFYGETTLHAVLERCTWHGAQHTRQLAMMLADQGIAPAQPLSEADLAGLPLPEAVWD